LQFDNKLQGHEFPHGGVTCCITADSVFAAPQKFFIGKCQDAEIESCQRPLLFLHINPAPNANRAIETKIVPIIQLFLNRHSEFTLLVGTDQYTPAVKDATHKIAANFKGHQVITYNYSDPLDLCKVLNRCSVIVTHKLHVGIVGARLEKSVISFSGHTEKIERLWRQLGYPNRSIPLSQLTTDKGLNLLETEWNKKILIPQAIINAARQNFTELEKFLEGI